MAGFKDLKAYQKAFSLTMDISHASKRFPPEEKYALTDQIRRSSRSVTVNLAEAYRKRRYQAYFISKLIDCDGENSETQSWLQFALACGYLSNELANQLEAKSEEIGKMLSFMIDYPEKFGSVKP
jgi:four helix bundle protein